MQKTFRFLAYALIVPVIVIVTSPFAFADTILTYRGLPFSFVTSPYTTSMHLTVILDLAAPLPSYSGPTPDDFQVTPISFTISDGIDTITNRAATSSFFQFGLASEPSASGTSEADDIMGWTVIADAVIGGHSIELRTIGGWDVGGANPCFDCVAGPINPLNPGGVTAGTDQGTGQWTIPEPASLPLLLLTIAAASVAMMLNKRTRQQKGQA